MNIYNTRLNKPRGTVIAVSVLFLGLMVLLRLMVFRVPGTSLRIYLSRVAPPRVWITVFFSGIAVMISSFLFLPEPSTFVLTMIAGIIMIVIGIRHRVRRFEYHDDEKSSSIVLGHPSIKDVI